MAELRIKKVDDTEIDTILAEDIDFTGELSFGRPLMIKGKFSGTIKASGDLYVGDNAFVEARIEANVVSLKGKIKGNVYAKSRVEIFSSATVDGDITAPDIIMESGCRFNGMCNMPVDKQQSGEEK
jgi:cytoskeletal protein CcmA (bactofilin family)